MFADRVKENCTATGFGPITLNGVSSVDCAPFSVIADGQIYYCVVTLAGTWEIRQGTKTGNTVTRGTIFSTSSGGTAVSLPAGTHQIFSVWPAAAALTAQTIPGIAGLQAALDAKQATIANVSLALTKLVSAPSLGFVGRFSDIGAPLNPYEHVTGADAVNILPVFSSAQPGLVPASGGSALAYLNGAGGFTTPAAAVAIGGAVTGAAVDKLLSTDASGNLIQPGLFYRPLTKKIFFESSLTGSLGSIEGKDGGIVLTRPDSGEAMFAGAYNTIGVNVPQGGAYGWAMPGDIRTPDTIISRLAAGSLAIGILPYGNTSGKLSLTILNNQPLTVGTLPVGVAGDTAIVVDAISDVRGSIVAAGGALFVRVLKDAANWRVN